MQIIPVAGGKGGVGKSLLSANLAIALGKAGKNVILADLDLGASNLHLVLGAQSPKCGIGTYLSGKQNFQEIITPTDYKNVSFIAGDSELPGLTAIKPQQKIDLMKSLLSLKCDYLILDLGAGTHISILDFFLLSPQGVMVSAPTVTATLNAYLFLKNAIFRIMANTFRQESPAFAYLDELKKDTQGLQRLYIPKLVEKLQEIDPESTNKFKARLQRFRPRLIFNMLDDPKDAEKAQKIRRSCKEYLDLNLEHLGVIYRDSTQDKALSSRLPVVVYKPESIISQAIFRIADRIIQSNDAQFDKDFDPATLSEMTFSAAEDEAQDDFIAKLAYIEDMAGSGSLTSGEISEILKQMNYEINCLKKENNMLRSKLLKAAQQGFKI